MNHLRYILAIILGTLATFVQAENSTMAESNDKLDKPFVFVDSVTSAKYEFPKGTRQIDPKDDARFVAELPNGNYLYLYSYKNKESKPFTWGEITQGEMKNYNEMTSQRPVKIKKVQGWHRQYRYLDNNDVPQYKMLTTIRGNDNATYIYEFANDTTNWLIPTILHHSEVPKFTARTGKMHVWGLFMILAIALSCLAFPDLKKQKIFTQVGICIGVGVLLFICMALVTSLSYWIIFMSCAFVSLIWLLNSRETDNAYFISNIIKKIIDQLN